MKKIFSLVLVLLMSICLFTACSDGLSGGECQCSPDAACACATVNECGCGVSQTVYKLSFDSNGADGGSMSDIDVRKGEGIILPENTFTKTDYIFKGWARKSGGDVAYLNTSDFVLTTEASVTLYAVWDSPDAACACATVNECGCGVSQTVYKLSFDSNGADGGSMSDVDVRKGEGIILPENTFTKADYIFKGWARKSGGDVAYLNTSDFVLTTEASVTLYAVWEYDFRGFEFELVGDEYIIVGYNGSGGIGVILPRTFNDKPVTGVDTWVFESVYIEYVVVHDGIDYMNWDALSGARNDIMVFCETESSLVTNWHVNWVNSNYPVYWKGEWQYNAVTGKPEPIV